MSSQPSIEPVPASLLTPPSKGVKPPVNSNLQELPFKELSWENFEKLCLRLARLETDVEHCQCYGVQGDEQDGIDLYARQRTASTYRVYQCKNEKYFGPKKIEDAVTEFLDGDWVTKADTLVLCTRESLASVARANELERQAKKLKSRGITLLAWDSDELSLKLKARPQIVHDFFSRGWVEIFCGIEVAASLAIDWMLMKSSLSAYNLVNFIDTYSTIMILASSLTISSNCGTPEFGGQCL